MARGGWKGEIKYKRKGKKKRKKRGGGEEREKSREEGQKREKTNEKKKGAGGRGRGGLEGGGYLICDIKTIPVGQVAASSRVLNNVL